MMLSFSFHFCKTITYLQKWKLKLSITKTVTTAFHLYNKDLQKWKLKLSITKTVTTAFHLYNKEARHELNIAVKGRTLPFCSEPTYLGIKLDILIINTTANIVKNSLLRMFWPSAGSIVNAKSN